MSRLGQPGQARIAEKLTILNERGNGLLTRLYELKKSLAKPDTRPKVLTEKSLESTIKSIDKKFNPTSCSASNLGSALSSTLRADVIKGMQQSYFTFVDIMEFNDHVRELLVFIDANQIHFDISLNFDLTKHYLDLIISYVSLMVLLSRVDERKIIIGLYNVAYEIQHSSSETHFHRLGQLMLDFDPPIKKINEDFIPHVKTLTYALLSLKTLYERRDLTANQWRGSQYLSIINEPLKLMEPARSETIPCEYLSMDIMQRWVILGFLIIHQQLGDASTNDLWKRALSGGWVLTLWRDEVLYVHPYVEKYFERVKGYEKRLREVKDIHHHRACIESTQIHKERRKFLRMTLKEMNLLFSDQPGLLGPKALMAFMALSHARDEIVWLLRHADNIPQKGKIRVNSEDLNDRQLPELLFYVEELRSIVTKYSQVLQRYFIQYLNGHDYHELRDIVTSCDSLSSDDNNILSHTLTKIQELNVGQLDESNPTDFMGLRMDWLRLQANCSSSKSQLPLKDNRALAKLMNTISFHTKMVDFLDQILNETADFSLYCFYTSLLEQQFKQCMEFPAQHRYSVVFPLLCSHFMTATHDLCPEEKLNIGQTSVQYCNWFLKEMAEEVNQVITAICEEQTRLNDKCLPKHCVEKLLYEHRKGQGRKKNQRVVEFQMPGEESKRRCREDFGRLDKLHMALTELSYALNHTSIIHVWGHGFVPREFFTHNLEGRFNKALPGMLMHNPANDEIAKPSEVLSGLRAMMDVLQSLESYVHVDISRIFNTVLLQQTQRVDGLVGEKTITMLYTTWYLDTLMRHIAAGHIVYSPLQKAFVSLSTEEKLSFSAEEYSDVKELRALCELIGPYGVRFLGEQLMNRVIAQVQQLKSDVASNKDILNELRTNFDKPDKMVELSRQLQNTDSVIQRLTIIGVLLSFRKMIQEVLYSNMVDHAPFLMSSIKDFSDNIPISPESTYINEMAASAGFDCAVDPLLVAAIRNMKPHPNEDEYKLSCLLMVFIAVVIPKKASNTLSAYDANLEGHVNNLHCVGRAINQLAQAMFLLHSKTGQSDVDERLKEFLALASSSLLRLGQENEKDAVRTRESVYLLLHIIVNESNQVLSMDLLESCFPYSLLRHAYSAVINNTINTSSK